MDEKNNIKNIDDEEMEIDEGDIGHKPMMKAIRLGGPGRGHFMEMDDCCGPDKFHMMKMKRKGKWRHKRRMKRFSRVEIVKDNANRIMFITLPGIDKSTLSVKAKKKAVLIESEYLEEFQRIYGEKLMEKLRLPFAINPDSIEAEYKTGILKLTFFDVEALDPEFDIDVSSTDE
jgi:HSP20 family molecular chaperone IbpA